MTCVETGETFPCQKSHEGETLFFADLPVGTTRTFRTSTATAPSATRVRATREGDAYTIDCGGLQIQIPASQTITTDAPGPILRLRREGKWYGHSTLEISGHPIVSIETEQLEDGPVRTTHRITYTTRTGHKYIASIQCTASNDFIRLVEDMSGLPDDALGHFAFAWTGCTFDYRQGPNRPYNFPGSPQKNYDAYPWEPIAPEHVDNQFGVAAGIDSAGRMPFSMLLFDPWQDVVAASFANFSSTKSPLAAGIFIDHPELWQDHEYAIWHSSPRLAVEFFYTNSTLSYVWKIARGTRSTCVAFYNHAKDVEAMTELEAIAHGVKGADGFNYRSGMFPTSYMLNQQNWLATLSLDRLKDWTLARPSGAAQQKQVFTTTRWKTAQDFIRTIVTSESVCQLALSGVRQNHGFGPVSSRDVLDEWTPAYQVFRDQLSADERRRVEGLLLYYAYIHAGEDYMPMQRMLAGHPNFLTDVKAVPPAIAFLFPDHPAADTWAEEWEAFVALNSRYHTRPAVPEWNARGGRWTENLGTYVWAFVRGGLRAGFLLRSRDGHERFLTPQIVALGDWLVNALSAPFAGESAATLKTIDEEIGRSPSAWRHFWGVVHQQDGPRRVHPPVGAHSERRKTPRSMWYMGHAMKNYAPLAGEHLMWAARPTDQDMETPVSPDEPYNVMFKQPDNRGTNPHLRSAKYTGYGVTLRAAVDTPQELSIHLIQIDEGPNYRWGNGDGISGLTYFYANGKAYSHNGTEDEGDRIAQDTDFGSNFGVWKNGAFRSIGSNVLNRPFYDLSVAQFTEIASRESSGHAESYSWPEYVSRNILLAGDDYFILFDKVFNPQITHRFSWFVRKGDPFPHISILSANPFGEFTFMTSVETATTSGRWVEGLGDSTICITHKDNIKPARTPFGAHVETPGGTDFVFLSSKPIDYHAGNITFSGTAGIVRQRTSGFELALFHGNSIAAAGVTIATQNTDLGISARIDKDGLPSGIYFATEDTPVTVTLAKDHGAVALYIDGEKVPTKTSQSAFTFTANAGEHRWELALGLPVPAAPHVAGTQAMASGAIVQVRPVASASSYELEVSADNAATWTSRGVSGGPDFKLTALEDGKKYHVRFTAINASHRSSPGPEYPVYVTSKPLDPPDGLRVGLHGGSANLTWGEVLGVIEYRLYRRSRGETSFQKIYSGPDRAFTDKNSAIVPAIDTPAAPTSAPACEYHVTAVSHIGESAPSRTANTDPASWRNWDPTPGEPFRRTVTRTGTGVPTDGIGRYYPALKQPLALHESNE
jgi:hypothetical protein